MRFCNTYNTKSNVYMEKRKKKKTSGSLQANVSKRAYAVADNKKKTYHILFVHVLQFCQMTNDKPITSYINIKQEI